MSDSDKINELENRVRFLEEQLMRFQFPQHFGPTSPFVPIQPLTPSNPPFWPTVTCNV